MMTVRKDKYEMNKIWYVWYEIEESRGWLVVSELWCTTIYYIKG